MSKSEMHGHLSLLVSHKRLSRKKKNVSSCPVLVLFVWFLRCIWSGNVALKLSCQTLKESKLSCLLIPFCLPFWDPIQVHTPSSKLKQTTKQTYKPPWIVHPPFVPVFTSVKSTLSVNRKYAHVLSMCSVRACTLNWACPEDCKLADWNEVISLTNSRRFVWHHSRQRVHLFSQAPFWVMSSLNCAISKWNQGNFSAIKETNRWHIIQLIILNYSLRPAEIHYHKRFTQ